MRVDNAVLAVLSVAATEGNQLFLTGQLDRKLYEKTNKVLEAAGGEIEALPDGAFKQSGTMVNTVVVTIPGDSA